MFIKLQILFLVVFYGWFVSVKAQNVKSDSVPYRLVVDGLYYSGNMESYVEDGSYFFCSFYIVNNSNDTLQYRQKQPKLNDFFSVTINNLDVVVINNSEHMPLFERTTILPHSSQHKCLKLAINKYPDVPIELKVDMKFYQWFKIKDIENNGRSYENQILSDKIKLTLDYYGGSYFSQADWIEKEKLAGCLPGIFTSVASSEKLQNKTDSISPRLVIDRSTDSWEADAHYQILDAYIVNYSDDTLKYWGTRNQFSDFFKVTGCDGLRLVNDEPMWNRNLPVAEQIIIPPRRSQHMRLKLLTIKNFSGVFQLNFMMKFYRLFDTKDFEADKKYHNPETLSDKITITFKDNGGSSSSRDKRTKKQEQILPSADFNLIKDENSNYNVTIDERTISKIRYHTVDYYDRYKIRGSEHNQSSQDIVLLVPVTIHNNSNGELKYQSMSCSWEEYYFVNNKKFSVIQSPCMKNIPIDIIVPPHACRTQIVTLFYAKDDPKDLKLLKIGLSVTKMSYYPNDYTIIQNNIIWSNEVPLNTN